MNAKSLRNVVCLLLLAGLSLTPALRANEEGKDLAAADARLNEAYQGILKSVSGAKAKAKLRDAQRAWVAFRNAEIAFYAVFAKGAGDQLKMLQTELTDARTKQLKEITANTR